MILRHFKMKKVGRFLSTLCLILVFSLIHLSSWASHIFGGAVTYECDGTGRYVFQLVIYRDCNGADVSGANQILKVWNHPVLNQIILNYVDRQTISPQGTNVPGQPACFDCQPGGNVGLGSIEKVTYKSNPIQISGVPPRDGWVFTYDDFSRNGNISNLNNPLNYGVTLRAKIFNVNTANNTCNDNSVQFLQAPHFITCTGKPYKMNLNPVDRDLDSIHIEWDRPLNYLANNPYQEGVNPGPIPFVNGYGYDSPTPNSTMNPLNQNAVLNSSNGELTFLSNLSGNFVIKIKASSYRNGDLISIVEHEFQVIVTNCLWSNNVPTVAGPFGGTWETTVDAGDLVQFRVQSSDPEFLQNGVPQTNSIVATGLLFGPNAQVATGCLIEPCPTVSPLQPVVGVQGATMQFSWQTDCDHLLGITGNEQDFVPYQFVFRVQDDFCPIPEVVYQTVTVNVRNPSVVPATNLTCIQGGLNNQFTINWNPVNNVNNAFVAYELYTVEQGLVQVFNTINTTSFTTTLTDDFQWYIAVVSGCTGEARRYSDTLRNIYLNLSNANLGIGEMDWNRPSNPARNGMSSSYNIWKEYPIGTWSVLGQTPYNLPQYDDVISVCSEFLSYYIELQDGNCTQRSQISGNIFSDQTPPNISSMSNVSIDTLTGLTVVQWEQSSSPDTYGYIVYVTDPVTNWLVELDTIWGANNVTYSYLEDYDAGPLNYTVAAFDSCPSPLGAPFNLSARDPNLQATIYLEAIPAICGGLIDLEWTPYVGWQVAQYEVFTSLNQGVWQSTPVGLEQFFSFQANAGESIRFFVKATSVDGEISFSRIRNVDVEVANLPDYHFIQFASVDYLNKTVRISYTLDPSVPASRYELQKLVNGQFVKLAETTNLTEVWDFVDTDVQVDLMTYTYRAFYYDTCNLRSVASNSATTMLVTAQIDQTQLLTYVTWTPYQFFDGSIVNYYIHRRITDTYEGAEIGQTSILKRSFQDNIYSIETEGLVCYVIQANEGVNRKAESNYAMSNEVCLEVEPILFVPNAFLPDGEVNTIFIPVLRNVDVESYQFAIFDRWGQTIFQTNDLSEGWDGSVNRSGKTSAMGVYNYIISFDLGFGEQFVKRGHVNLIR